MSRICVIHHIPAHLIRPRSHLCRHRPAVLPHRPRCYISSCLQDILHQEKALMMYEERKKENIIKNSAKVFDQFRLKWSWDPPWWDSQGRAQSKNSSWSMATSPLWPWERCEWKRIWKAEGIRPRKMVPSLQLRTLVASGRHTTASWESWCTMEAHKGVEPRPVWSNNTPY